MPRIIQKKEITKTRAKINKIQNRKNREKSTKPRGCSLKRSRKLTNI